MPGPKRSRRLRSKPAPGLILGRENAPPPPVPAFGFSPAPPAPPTRRSEGDLITYRGDGHLITFAPTGAGKSAGPVICNALNHPGQLIVMDIKGEVHHATARRRREMGQAVHVLDLRDGMPTDSLNPLDLAALTGTDAAAIARTLATDLVARTGQERDPFWPDWAENLLSGSINWLLSDCPPEARNLHRLYDLFTAADTEYEIATLLDTKAIAARSAVAVFGSFLSLPERDTRPSVLGCAVAPLRLFDSDLVRTLTGTTSIDLAALVEGKPMTL
jgi:type IV secretion system protein VirD4